MTESGSKMEAKTSGWLEPFPAARADTIDAISVGNGGVGPLIQEIPAKIFKSSKGDKVPDQVSLARR